ncbi:unnamed protein product, partial [Vitis vinifera]|uniref:Uncharacterized protein n=1 Tax=Vitis vinifera TaxID=29760 RepID=D7TX63_VITVI
MHFVDRNSALHLNDPYNPNSSFLSQFALLESSSVDDDLASLKKELSRSSKKGELPPGRTAVASNTAFPFRDSEIEKELNELRRKASEF